MDRNQAKELLPIIKAYVEGKTIQLQHIDCTWKDAKYLNLGRGLIYRIKPEPKYRPFANAEECWNEMQKHQTFGWLKDKSSNKLIIENVDSRGCVEVYNGGACSFNEVFEYFTFADRLPFGVKVEE